MPTQLYSLSRGGIRIGYLPLFIYRKIHNYLYFYWRGL